jgi:hypothetical protein
MAIRFQARPMLCVFGVALFGLAACNQLGQGGEMGWARAAIERNGQLEVVAVDSNNAVFTVRVKETGELRTVRADEVIGMLPGSENAASKPAAAPATTPPPATPPTQTAANAPSSSDVAQPGDTAAPPAYEDATPAQTAQAEPAPVTEPTGRGVLATGPGYSIKRASGITTNPVPVARQVSTADSRSPAAGLSVEHRYEPIICQGGRLLHIDSRNLEFEGDAVSAEDGCEIHITNSRISAKGVGVFARAANVHIKNSSIEGTTGSVEATNGAQVYVQSSTFKGLSRRLDTAALHDLGGNVWN